MHHQLVQTGVAGAADGAVEVLLVGELLVFSPGLGREEVLLTPEVPAPPQIVLEEKVGPAVREHSVTDVAGVLLTGAAGSCHHAPLLAGLRADRLLGQGAVTEVVLERTARESLQESKVREVVEVFDVIDQLEALQGFITEKTLEYSYYIHCYQVTIKI